MSKHIVTVTTYGTIEPVREVVPHVRAFTKLVERLSRYTDIDTVNVQIDWSEGRSAAHDGGLVALEARDAGWSYH
jgi:hypothetical protein